MLQTWAEQRDSLHREIAAASSELEEKTKLNIQAGLDYAALQISIAEARGRLAELTSLEERTRTSVAADVADLIAKKSRLESECAGKEEELKTFHTRIAERVVAIEILSNAYTKVTDQTAIVDQIVGQVIKNSNEYILRTTQSLHEVQNITTAVIEKSKENLKETNIVLEKMPKFIFDMQKPIPVRRTYPPGHPHAPVISE